MQNAMQMRCKRNGEIVVLWKEVGQKLWKVRRQKNARRQKMFDARTSGEGLRILTEPVD